MIRVFRTALAAILLALASAALAQDITQVSPTTFDGSFFARTAGKIGLAMSSASLRAALTDESGTGAAYFQDGNLGTPSAGVLTNATGLPISTGVAGLGAGVATWLGTPSSANLAAAVTDETGSGALVFGTSPTIASPALSGTATGTYTLGGTPTLSGGTLSGTTTLTGMTAGSVLFAGAAGALSQDNANLFWDNTNKRLGIGAAPPQTKFHVGGAIDATGNVGSVGHFVMTADGSGVIVGRNGANPYELNLEVSAAGTYAGVRAGRGGVGPQILTLNRTGGNVGIGTATPQATTHVNGSALIGAAAAFTASSGELGLTKITASGTAPGAGAGKLALVCGTNAGSAKLIAYAGTSTTAVTILDNIGSGVTGC